MHGSQGQGKRPDINTETGCSRLVIYPKSIFAEVKVFLTDIFEPEMFYITVNYGSKGFYPTAKFLKASLAGRLPSSTKPEFLKVLRANVWLQIC